ncbi:carbohydrate-binding module family 50 protein [Daldinia decipiens]|uniref:carbohydrate-binding module family 50 protein n=1 Tax=Daldinia decipiens TaxID=326647 RepID=UPI0020C3FC7E|nr:carbohydrate-binding module family 50 protein [Daldinia decipiens]KAI1657569.1 carbohydrate-binding module family 50 protein [Daldinia decipiens]
MFAITAIVSVLALAANQVLAFPTELFPRQGYVENCKTTYSVVSGDTCLGIISKFNNAFTLDQFYSMNPQVAKDCSNLYPGELVCVALKESTEPVCPAPTSDDIAPNCNACYHVVEGDNCWTITQAKNISFNDFRKWNPSIDASCSNLQLGYNYCIGVSA